jgi:hypothetical protein
MNKKISSYLKIINLQIENVMQENRYRFYLKR